MNCIWWLSVSHLLVWWLHQSEIDSYQSLLTLRLFYPKLHIYSYKCKAFLTSFLTLVMTAILRERKIVWVTPAFPKKVENLPKNTGKNWYVLETLETWNIEKMFGKNNSLWPKELSSSYCELLNFLRVGRGLYLIAFCIKISFVHIICISTYYWTNPGSNIPWNTVVWPPSSYL